MNIRVNNYRCFINKRRRESVAEHFFTDGHTFSDFQITAIDIIPNADHHTLCNKETFYIKLFKTLQPDGLNTKDQHTYPIANYWYLLQCIQHQRLFYLLLSTSIYTTSSIISLIIPLSNQSYLSQINDHYCILNIQFLVLYTQT